MSEHRIEMIDTEINVLRQMWQSPATTDGQSHIIVQRVADLLAERRSLAADSESREETP